METISAEQEEWRSICSRFANLSLMQTWEYGETKAALEPWTINRVIFKKKNDIVGAAQILLRTLPLIGGGLAWVNRGPICQSRRDHQANEYLRQIILKLKQFFSAKGYYFRIAPPLLYNDNNIALIRNCGLRQCKPTSFWASHWIDLEQSVETLRKNLKAKWRNCLNKSIRSDLVLQVGSFAEMFDELLEEYVKVIRRKKFLVGMPPAALRYLQKILPSNQKMIVFQARRNGELLGSILVATYDKSGIYLVSAVKEKGRSFNVNYFLLWNAILTIKDLGFTRFDLGGVNEVITPKGILHFKKGLQGKPYRLVGEYEYCNGIFRPRLSQWVVNKKRISQFMVLQDDSKLSKCSYVGAGGGN
jgi:lipid II:glycine glycyltransferase (peptidoglycan interpeptide bridge formation enzyme)